MIAANMGVRIFRDLREAIAQGYHVYDRTAYGYLLRIRLGDRWALAEYWGAVQV